MKKILVVAVLGLMMPVSFVLGVDTNSSSVVSPTCSSITRSLGFGSTDKSTGGQVTQLQKFLKDQGVYVNSLTTGLYDSTTVAAVKKWQAEKGIISSGTLAQGYGVVGPKTLASISATCRGTSSLSSVIFYRTLKIGSTGVDVKSLQVFLNKDTKTKIALKGSGSPGLETTYYGPATSAAVKKFQTLHKDEVLTPYKKSIGSGLVDEPTRQLLNKLLPKTSNELSSIADKVVVISGTTNISGGVGGGNSGNNANNGNGGGSSQPVTYTITSTGSLGGSINPGGTISVKEGGSQTISFSPSSGYQVSALTVDGAQVSATNQYTFSSVKSNHTINVAFAQTTIPPINQNTHTIVSSAGVGGSISPAGTNSIVDGNSKTFTITPSSGFQIATVMIDGANQGPISTYTFNTITTDHTISVTFSQIVYSITASSGSNGTITPSGTVPVNAGATQNFTLKANSGYQLASVTIDGTAQTLAATYSFTNISASHTIAATFSQIQTYTITATSDANGTISPTGMVATNAGTSQTFTMTPAAGYQVNAVTVDGTSVGAVSTYTFSNVSAAHTISVTYSQTTSQPPTTINGIPDPSPALLNTPISSTAKTYYISPTGSDSTGDGTTAKPWATFVFAYTKMKGGDILIVKSGTYNKQTVLSSDNSGVGYTIPAGSPSGYTIVKAEVDGDAIIDGQGVMSPLNANGTHSLSNMSYFVIEGLVFKNQGSGGYLYNVNHAKLIRDGFENAGDGNNVVVSNSNSSYLLYEECYAWGSGRYKFSSYYSDHIVYRRNVARFDRAHPQHDGVSEPIAVFAAYSSNSVEFQNDIAIDSDHPEMWIAPDGIWGGYFVPTTSDPSTDVNIRGSIALNLAMGFGSTDWGGTPLIENSVGWHVQQGYYARNKATINHSTFGDVYGPSVIGGQVGLYYYPGSYGTPSAAVINNSIIQNVKGNALTSLGAEDYNVLYGNTANYSSTPTGTHNSTQNPSLQYITRVEPSNVVLHGTASDGGDRGANILYEYGTPGSLWGDPGYNSLTSQQLWPFPFESKIGQNMRNYSYTGPSSSGASVTLSGNRGFAQTGQTLTNYIWNYLGNATPYNAFVPDATVQPPVTPPTGSGVTYYVSPTGSDTANGGSATPWKTLQNAVQYLKPGDTLNVRAGSYAGFIVGWDAAGQGIYGAIAGTAGKPITIQADPSAPAGSVIINNKNPKTQVGIDLEPDCNYITIKGFVVDAAGTFAIYPNKGNGIKATGQHDTVLNNIVKNLDYSVGGITSDGADYVDIENNDVSHVGWHNNGSYGHGIYVADSNFAIVRNNTIHDNDYIGLHINGDPNLVSNALIEYNVIYNNGQNAINADGLQSSTIRNNLLYNFANTGITMFQIDASGPSKNNIIVNNTIIAGPASTGAAIRIVNSGTGNTITNNILEGGNGITLRIATDSISGLVEDYNIVGNSYDSSDSGSIKTFANWKTSSGQDAHSILVATPSSLFANMSGANYQLSASSAAINAGTASNAPANDILGTSRPQSGAYDIGAYEYTGTVITPPSTTYTITASAGSNGSISPSGATSVTSGNSVSYTISPNSGYKIASVTVDGSSVGTGSSYSFSNVVTNHTISATFSVVSVTPPATYTVTASAGSNGSISPSGATSVTSGNSVSYAITPNSGYQINTLTIDGGSSSVVSSYTFSNVVANHTISATFSPVTVTPPVNPPAGGSSISIDSSSPARVTKSRSVGSGSTVVTTGAFTPPDNSVIIVTISSDSNNNYPTLNMSVSNTGTPLTWTRIVKEEQSDSGKGGYAGAYYAVVPTAQQNMTVTVTDGSADATLSAKVYVVTGATLGSPIGATQAGGSTVNNLSTTAFSSVAANSRGFAVGTDWNQVGTPSSTDVADVFDSAGNISGISAYKASNTASAGSSVVLNLDAAGSASPLWNWVSFEIK